MEAEGDTVSKSP